MELPGSERLTHLLSEMAHLKMLGAEPVRGLVQPTQEFFPERLDGKPESFGAVAQRMLEHAGLSHVNVRVGAMGSPDGEDGKACGTGGGCGTKGPDTFQPPRVLVEPSGYVVALDPACLGNPVAFSTMVARATGLIFLRESGAVPTFRADISEYTRGDLATALLGFGVLVLNGSYIYGKSCSCVTIQTATQIDAGDAAVALAAACKLFGADPVEAKRYLDPTPRAYFEEAWTWAHSNQKVLDELKKDPQRVAQGTFSLSPTRSWLARLLHREKDPEELLRQDLAHKSATRPTISKEKAARLAEIKALLDEP